MPVSRRDLLKSSVGAVGLLGLRTTMPGPLVRADSPAAKQDRSGNVLVVVQLAGGNDGLNTVVPYADDIYARSRRTLRLSDKQVLKIDSLVGFHPEMRAFKRLYDEGLAAVVQGVGYPNPHGDHVTSMRFWHTARPHQTSVQTGWIGRAADQVYQPETLDVPAIFVGRIRRPFLINAEKALIPAIRGPQQAVLQTMPGGSQRSPLSGRGEKPAARQPHGGNPLLGFVERTAAAARKASQRIEEVLRADKSGGLYPASEFGQMLHAIGQLIRAELGIRVMVTELGGEQPGGWDTHAVQFANHAALLKQLSEGLAAFAADLQQDRLLDHVLLMTFSEFGRTLLENGRRGTDHGSAAPILLVGGKLKGGLIGPHPSLAQTEGGGVKHHTDFRRVYATVLENWLGWESQPIVGPGFAPLELLSL
ncbi:MAG: DUF1501 domain-containing protein [Thermoguttaceae bacterium]